MMLVANISREMMLVANIKDTDSSASALPGQTCRRFTLLEIQSATNNFDNTLIIGRGGFGDVYKCPIKIGTEREVAVKRLHSMSNQGSREFEAEVQVLSKLQHDNLVSLLGYCNEENEMVLVYEFIPNGTLEGHLRTPHSCLSWLQRLKICIGAAQGLEYLHMGGSSQHGVIHRDVKSSNILLNANFDAKISDFGLAKFDRIDRTHVSTAVKGTFGYMDPCYFHTGNLTKKSDVYAFGVVLLEVLSGRKVVDSTLYGEQWGLAGWAQHQMKQGKVSQITDPRLMGQISKKCLKEFASMACQCLHSETKQRPNMADLVYKLQSILLQERENTNSVFEEESIVYKLRSLFTGKVDAQNKYIPTLKAIGANEAVTMFSSEYLQRATGNYSKGRIIGQSSSGTVFRGMLLDGRIVAIKKFKRLDGTSQVEQFLNELRILSQVNHRNVFKLLGCCLEEKIPVLVYEFICNDTLYYHLHDESGMGWLTWETRLRVAAEVASALAYLHSHTMPIIHKNITSANILLDERFSAKISDFCARGLVTFDYDHGTTIVHQKFGYLDPDFFYAGKPTGKTDVYSFGVVLAELITGKKPISFDRTIEERNLATYFVDSMKKNSLLQIVEPLVLREASPEQLQAVAELVKRCLNSVGEGRPAMREVEMELESLRRLTPRRSSNDWGSYSGIIEMKSQESSPH